MKSALYIGQVYHKRRRPAEHVLRYRVFSLLLNLDEIDSLDKRFWLFSRNRWNLFSFFDKDFGELVTNNASLAKSTRETLKEYVVRNLKLAGIEQEPVTTLLSCYPRVCGYTFNPLSLFYCLDDNENVFAVLHEVHNTFGERHVYVLPVDQPHTASKAASKTEGDATPTAQSVVEPTGTNTPNWIEQGTRKELFVSPFAHMNMQYRFRLNKPDDKQVIVIHVDDEDGHWLTASYTAERHNLDASRLLRCFVSFPALTFKVTAGIHWEALRLFIKKVPWFSHQAKNTFSSNFFK